MHGCWGAAENFKLKEIWTGNMRVNQGLRGKEETPEKKESCVSQSTDMRREWKETMEG